MGIRLITETPQVSASELDQIAHALTVQLHEHVAPIWRMLPLSVSTRNHPSWYRFTFVDDIPEAPDALAYHTVDGDGRPYGRIGVNICRQAGVSPSSAASHEAVELFGDVYCATWVDSRRLGGFVPRELADAVESSAYDIDGVEVSNFVTPWWFTEDGQPHEYDWLGHLFAPFTLESGGYTLVEQGGTVSTKWGDGSRPELVAAHGVSRGRSFWREAQVAAQLFGRTR